jgi:hypothetical protein
MQMSGGDANMPGAPGNLAGMAMAMGPSGGMGYLAPPYNNNMQAMFGALTPMDMKRTYAQGPMMGMGGMPPMGPMGATGPMGRMGPMGREGMDDEQMA